MAEKKMYVRQENGMFVLRQSRYAKQLARGKGHPHDICAYARSVEEMRAMCDKHWPNNIDYSQVENAG